MIRRASCVAAFTFFISANARADEPKLSFDPLDDGLMLGMSLALGTTAQVMTADGQIKPVQISSTFQRSDLPFLDRFALDIHIDPNATTMATIGDVVAFAFAAVHPIVDGISRGKQAFWDDAAIYAETISLNSTLGAITRLTVRRPRPIAYQHRDTYIAQGGNPATYYDDKVDDTQSFYSGHVSATASVTGAATYLMFLRYGKNDARPWLTLGIGTALSAFVAVERVRAGDHFPTDTIAGGLIGGATGLLVVQAHRLDSFPHRSIWLGAAPTLDHAGGMLTLAGFF